MTFRTAALSGTGGRPRNEDFAAYRIFPGGGCWALADGLGAHGNGRVAAELAVNAALSHDGAARERLDAAQQAVSARQREEPELAGMRSTLAVLVCREGAAGWAHAGDTRLYHFRAARIRHRTLDHSVPQALCAAGEITAAQIRFHEDRPRLLCALGEARLRPSHAAAGVAPGDAFLLCTDGLWEHVTEDAMEGALAGASGPGPWLAALVGGMRPGAVSDNWSAIAVWIEEAPDV